MIAFLSKIITLTNLNIVGVIRNDGGETYNLLSVKKKRDKIDIVTNLSFTNFSDLWRNIDTKLPIILVVDGKGVLNKKIDVNNEIDINWQKNIDFSTIYHTSYKSNNLNFISFCRKNNVDEIILKFQKKNLQLADVYVGSFLGSLIQNTIKKNEIVSGDLLLEFDNNQLIDFKKQNESIKTETYKIGNDNILSTILPLYGVIIHFFLKQKEVTKSKNDSLNVEEIVYKKAFNVFGIVMLVGFLATLLLSFILIQYYNSENNELKMQNVYSNQSYQKILNLEKQKQNKLNIMKNSGFLSSKFFSFYSYEIIKAMPTDISLNELNINPLSKEVKAFQKIVFDSNTIKIKGETFDESSFSRWINELKKMNWIQKFEIISLKKDKKNKSLFEIKIIIKNV